MTVLHDRAQRKARTRLKYKAAYARLPPYLQCKVQEEHVREPAFTRFATLLQAHKFASYKV